MNQFIMLKGKKEIKYFFGIYRDYDEKIKVGQLCLTVDDLSCEILAEPGCITFYQKSRVAAINNAKALSKQYGCNLIEYNLEKYRVNKVNQKACHS